MPLIAKYDLDASQHVYVWKIEESCDALKADLLLTEAEQKQYNSFGGEMRKKQWLATRHLLQSNHPRLPEIQYYESGKPYLGTDHPDLSITHSSDLVALQLRNDGPAGIDLQYHTEKIHRIKQRFLTETEWETFHALDDALEYLTLVWAAKEALYKVHGDREVFFKEHLEIQLRGPLKKEGEIEGFLQNVRYNESFVLKYRNFEKFILVYLVE